MALADEAARRLRILLVRIGGPVPAILDPDHAPPRLRWCFDPVVRDTVEAVSETLGDGGAAEVGVVAGFLTAGASAVGSTVG